MNPKTDLSATQRRALLTHPAGWIAIGFGAGLAPLAQGTVGSAVAVLPWLGLRLLPVGWYGLMLVVMFALGVWACEISGRRIHFADHRALVWDEFVGQWIAWLPALLAPWWAVLAGFVLFRLFDVWKPWPIGWLDARVKGGLGVMLDDVVAGIFCRHRAGRRSVFRRVTTSLPGCRRAAPESGSGHVAIPGFRCAASRLRIVCRSPLVGDRSCARPIKSGRPQVGSYNS